MAGLRVLLTNTSLDMRGGTQLYIRDVAISLLKRGHSPIAYSARLGAVAQELRRATVPVVDDLHQISVVPDIIHGQHHVETMTALLHFQNVPAVYFCHGWLPWEETPPRFPRILRYVAVDYTCRDRLIYEHGIPEELTRVVLNFVDLERFKPRAPLPARPRRALVFSNNATEATHVSAVREACGQAGIALDVIGEGAGNVAAQPESVLGNYDLVFAKARCALEAMAVGVPVVLCDVVGVGPLVTSGELQHLRRLNFGIRTLRNEVRADVLLDEIARYDPADAAEVTRRIRADAGIETAVDELVALYEDVVSAHAEACSSDPVAEGRAAADYLQWMSASIRRERAIYTNSTTIRLRNRLLNLRLLRPFARSLAKRVPK